MSESKIIMSAQQLDDFVARIGNARDLVSAVCESIRADGSLEGALFGIVYLLDCISRDLDNAVLSAAEYIPDGRVVA